MVDKYIDNRECVEYGDFFCNHVPSLFGLDPIVARLCTGQETLNQRMRLTLRDSYSADGDIRLAIDERGPVGIEAVQWTGLFFDQLQLWQKSGQVHVAFGEFFASPKKTAIGQSPAQQESAIERILGGLDKYDVPDKADWRTRFTDLHGRLKALKTAAEEARRERKPVTESLAAARDAWLRHYAAAKDIISGLLRLHGREAELRNYFKDLQVNAPRSRATTDAPADA